MDEIKMSPKMVEALAAAASATDGRVPDSFARQSVHALRVKGLVDFHGRLTGRGRLYVTEREVPCALCGAPVRALAPGAVCSYHSGGGPHGDGLCARQRAKKGHASGG